MPQGRDSLRRITHPTLDARAYTSRSNSLASRSCPARRCSSASTSAMATYSPALAQRGAGKAPELLGPFERVSQFGGDQQCSRNKVSRASSGKINSSKLTSRLTALAGSSASPSATSSRSQALSPRGEENGLPNPIDPSLPSARGQRTSCHHEPGTRCEAARAFSASSSAPLSRSGSMASRSSLLQRRSQFHA